MRYNWAGDVIFRDTVLPNKRFVIGSPGHGVTADIREWLQWGDNQVMGRAAKQIPGLPQTRGIGDFDRRAHAAWAYVAGHVHYNYDKDRRGYDDFWLFAEETLSLADGDCEDSSILLAALMIFCGISPYCVRVVLGHLYEGPRLLGSHAWVVYQDEGGIWRLLESTLDAVPPTLPDADALTQPGAPRFYRPDFCFNGDHLWWIAPPARAEISPPLGLDDYLRRRAQAGVVNAGMPQPVRQQILSYMHRIPGRPPHPPPPYPAKR